MKFPAPAVLIFALAATSGCSLLHHKKHGAPEPPPSAGIESEFRGRWIDRRVKDLMTANPSLSESAAQADAAAEFAKQYPYLLTVGGGNKP